MIIRRTRVLAVAAMIAVVPLTQCASDGGGSAGDEAAARCDADGDVIAATVGDDGVASVQVSGPDGEPARTVTGTWTASRPAFSPDGTRLAVVWADGDYESAGPGDTEIRTIGRDGSDPRRVTIGGNADDPAWSPDGTTIAFRTWSDQHQEEIAVVGADGGTPEVLAEGATPAWSPQGDRLAFVRAGEDPGPRQDRSELWTMAADGTDQQRLATVDVDVSWLTWTPDGTALVAGGDRTGLWRVDLDGTARMLAGKATMPAFSSDGERLYVAYRSGDDGWEAWQGRLDGDDLTLDRRLDVPIGFLYRYFGWSVASCPTPGRPG